MRRVELPRMRWAERAALFAAAAALAIGITGSGGVVLAAGAAHMRFAPPRDAHVATPPPVDAACADAQPDKWLHRFICGQEQ